MTDAPLGSLCPQCGYDVKVDEEGCCISCGGYSIGPGADEAHRWRNAARARVPDEAEVAAIRFRAEWDGEDADLAQTMMDRDTLLAALDAARARCKEVEKAWMGGYWPLGVEPPEAGKRIALLIAERDEAREAIVPAIQSEREYREKWAAAEAERDAALKNVARLEGLLIAKDEATRPPWRERYPIVMSGTEAGPAAKEEN